MEQNKTLIEKCAEIRTKRQRERENKGYNEDCWPPSLIEPYKVIDVTEFSAKHFFILSEAIKDGYALKYREMTERMAIATDPSVIKIINDGFGESGYNNWWQGPWFWQRKKEKYLYGCIEHTSAGSRG